MFLLSFEVKEICEKSDKKRSVGIGALITFKSLQGWQCFD
jgi:hypothetical protein